MTQNPDSPPLLYLNLPLDTAKGFLFGLQLPFLPDFLLDHTLLGKEPFDRIQEYSRRWTQFVSGLWRSRGGVETSQNVSINAFMSLIEVKSQPIGDIRFIEPIQI